MVKKMFKRLGTQITVITIAAVGVLVILLATFTILQFKSFTNNLLQQRSIAGERVLEATLTAQLDICCRD